MRTVAAVAMVLLLLPFVANVHAADEHDECGTLTHNKPCHDLTVTSPAPQAPLSKRYFLWLGVVKCNSPNDPECRGTPNDNHQGPTRVVPNAPTDVDYPYSAVAGILYEDTNGLGGLQRFKTVLSPTIVYPPDRMVLV